jgi:chromate transporter
MVLQFVGFLAAYRDPGALSPVAAGVVGSLLATWVTFAPCFFFIFAGAPFIERLRHNQALSTALAAITAAVVGVILNLAVWFALHTVFEEVISVQRSGVRFLIPQLDSLNVASALVTLVAAVAIFRFKVSVMKTLLGCAVLGLLIAVTFGTP